MSVQALEIKLKGTAPIPKAVREELKSMLAPLTKSVEDDPKTQTMKIQLNTGTKVELHYDPFLRIYRPTDKALPMIQEWMDKHNL